MWGGAPLSKVDGLHSSQLRRSINFLIWHLIISNLVSQNLTSSSSKVPSLIFQPPDIKPCIICNDCYFFKSMKHPVWWGPPTLIWMTCCMIWHLITVMFVVVMMMKMILRMVAMTMMTLRSTQSVLHDAMIAGFLTSHLIDGTLKKSTGVLWQLWSRWSSDERSQIDIYITRSSRGGEDFKSGLNMDDNDQNYEEEEDDDDSYPHRVTIEWTSVASLA